MGKLLQEDCRAEDLLCRYGGEEFAIALRQTDAQTGRAIAERIRLRVQATHFSYDDIEIPVTVSIGVATRAGEAIGSVDEIVASADAFMYLAKDRGRNQVVVA